MKDSVLKNNAILLRIELGASSSALIGLIETLVRQFLIEQFSFQDLIYESCLYGMLGILIGLIIALIAPNNLSVIGAIAMTYLLLAVLVIINQYYRMMPVAFSLEGILLNTLIILVCIFSYLMLNKKIKKIENTIIRKMPKIISFTVIVIIGFFSLNFAVKQKIELHHFEVKNDKLYKPKIVLLITIDALRYDHMSLYNYSRRTTPNLDKLAADALVFTEAFSTSSWTIPSVVSLFTGTYPNTHKAISKTSSVDPDMDTLSEIFNALGYKTASFMANAVFSPRAGAAQGFETFFPYIHPFSKSYFGDSYINTFIENIASRFISTNYYDSSVLTNKALTWIKENDEKNVFIYIHYMDCHEPYNPPDQSRKSILEFKDFHYPLNLNKHEKDLFDSYDGEVFNVDSYIGKFFNVLRKNNLYDDSLIIVTADHGEELYEHNSHGHAQTLFEESIHIPLIIKFPLQSQIKPRKINSIVGLTDIMPTLLDYFQIKDHKYIQGLSLFPLINDKASEIRSGYISMLPQCKLLSYREKRFKLIKEDAIYYLFDLKNDPLEKADIKEKNKELLNDLKLKLEMLLQSTRSNQFKANEMKLNENTIEQLRQLGYVK